MKTLRIATLSLLAFFIFSTAHVGALGMPAKEEVVGTCSPSISVEVVDGRVVVTGGGGGSCGGSFVQLNMNGLGGPFLGSKSCVEPTCTLTVTLPPCYATGVNIFGAYVLCNAWATRSDGATFCDRVINSPHAEQTVTISYKPDVSVSYEGPADDGSGVIHVNYAFPGTESAGQRYLQVDADGSSWWTRPETRDGLWSIPVTIAMCRVTPLTIRALAIACNGNPLNQDEAFTTATPSATKPNVSLTLAKGAPDPDTGRRAIEGTIDYDMGAASNGWSVSARVLRWITADGEEHEGGRSSGPSFRRNGRTKRHSFTTTPRPMRDKW